jgi:hypothetical protein
MADRVSRTASRAKGFTMAMISFIGGVPFRG